MLFAVGILGGTAAALYGSQRHCTVALEELTEDPAFLLWDFKRQTPVPWSVLPDDSVRGPRSAPFVVITYGDFQCPLCRELAEQLEKVQRRYPDKLAVVFRHFPLDGSCNALVDSHMHAFSCEASLAAEAARLLGGDKAFWKMHDALFAQQDELDAWPYGDLAERIGLDRVLLLSMMDDPSTQQRIKAHIDAAKRHKVKSTPAVLLSGRRLRSWKSMAFWEAVLAGPASGPTSQPTTLP